MLSVIKTKEGRIAVTGYYFACFFLLMLLLAFIPAMVAAHKTHRFTGWYIYSLFLFPVALAHSLMLKKPRHFVKIYQYKKDSPTKRIKRIYAAADEKKEWTLLPPRHLCAVFFSKLLFGTLVALALFALFRTFTADTLLLRITCIIFAICFSVLLSLTELLRLSKLPLIADEITKRALDIVLLCFTCSLPLFLFKTFILDYLMPSLSDFMLFLCTMISFVAFVLVLLSKQSKYYSFFYKFFDYCVISLFSYSIFAAASLILMSVVPDRIFNYALAMPVQGFNLRYLSGVDLIGNLPAIYSAALVHLFVLMILLISGFLCRNFKRKENEARIEYRYKAFRMSQKRILRRHIPKRHLQTMKD